VTTTPNNNNRDMRYEPVLWVESFDLAYTEDERALPVLQARGRVPCGAWSDAKLVPGDADAAALSSGVLEFRLLAKRPAVGSFVFETFNHSVTAIQVGELPAWVREVRVRSAFNFVEYCVDRSQPLPPTAKRARAVKMKTESAS
jgi:hypothetical protein